jgi:tripartite-type tricarboxylate transporter receptor subunit TctC
MLKSVRPITKAVMVAGLVLCSGAMAQTYPTKPIRLVVGYTPGGATDGVARVIAAKLAPALGQSVVIENKPGGGGTIGTAQVAQANADGYTLLLGTSSSISIAPFVYKTLPYDVRRDFVPITLVARVPQVLVMHPGFVQGGLGAVVQLARKEPGKHAYGSVGNGSSTHLAMEMFKQKAGIDVTHVPYKGSAPAETDLIGGQIPLALDTLQGAMPYIRSGKSQALAISTEKRSKLAPEIPTFTELGYPDVSNLSAWYGIMAPANLPGPIAEKLAAEIEKIVRSPDTQAQLMQLGAEATPLSGAAFAKFLDAERKRWGEAAKVSGAQID